MKSMPFLIVLSLAWLATIPVAQADGVQLARSDAEKYVDQNFPKLNPDDREVVIENRMDKAETLGTEDSDSKAPITFLSEPDGAVPAGGSLQAGIESSD